MLCASFVLWTTASRAASRGSSGERGGDEGGSGLVLPLLRVDALGLVTVVVLIAVISCRFACIRPASRRKVRGVCERAETVV
jgi:hypothetical protein